MHPSAFWLGCLGSRASIAVICAVWGHIFWIKFALMIFSVSVALGLFSLWYFDLRKNGIEASGEIWWNHLRPVHAFLWLVVGILLYSGKNTWASYVICVDVVLAVYARLVYKPRYFLTKR